MNNRKVYIYTLSESGIGDVRYVGQTVAPSARLQGHLSTDNLADDNPKRVWIQGVLDRGGRVELSVIDECSVLDAGEVEGRWIDYYLNQGAMLTNTRGGLSSPLVARPCSQPVTRIQVSTYFNEDLLLDWEVVKRFYGLGLCDAGVMRALIKDKAEEIRQSNTIEDMKERIISQYREIQQERRWQHELLLKISEKVGISAFDLDALKAAIAAGCDCVAEYDSEGYER